MNIAHCSLWNSALGAWVAVSEITRARGKRSGGGSAVVRGGSALALTLLLGCTPAFAGGDGGYGGNYADPAFPGPNYSAGSSTTGMGGHGGDAPIAVSGGVGGSIGGGGGVGTSDGGVVGGGGGGGGTGAVMTTNGAPNNTPITGGSGGSGARGGGDGRGGGGGGGGGAGVIAGPGLTSFTNNSTVTGGDGGGGAGGAGGGGGGGAGVLGNGTALFTITNSAGASITGGNGSNAGSRFGGQGGAGEGGAAGGNRSGGFGAGGAGIVGSNLTITNAGTISGGLSGDGARANAITFTGGSNSLELQASYSFTGNVDASAGTSNTLILGGNTNPAGAFDVSKLVATATPGANDQYVGFNAYRKTGTSTWTLTGSNTMATPWTINAGTLSVNGSIANSSVTVNNGGILGGNGTVGNMTIAAGGVLAPGNSIGTLTVNGSLSFAAGSIYRVEVDAAGNTDRTNVTGAPGTATINGGTVDVQAGAGTYATNTAYTILNATGGRTGAFSGVTSNLAFLTPTLAYDANNVFLNLARNDISYSAVAVTPNQIATSTALQNANAGATGDMSTVINAVTGLSAAQARAAYDAASGAGLVSLRNSGAGFLAGFGSQLQARLGVVGGESGAMANAFASQPVLLAANDHVSDLLASPRSDTPQKFSLAGGSSSSSSSATSPRGRGLWLRGSGGYQNTSSDGNAAASKLRSGGLSAGFDTELREGLVVGAAISSGTSRLSFDNNDSGKSRGSAVALYGSYVSGPWAFKGSASLAWNNNHMDRAVTVGALNRVASSDFDSNTLSAYGEATYSLPTNGWTLQPLAALSLSRDKVNGFTETGAAALNLQVAGQTITSTKSLLGAKAAFDTGSVRLEPRILWAHEFGDLNTPMTAQFQGAANASPFQVSGVALKRDTLILGLGASGSIQKNVDLFADVQAERNSRQNNLAVLLGLRVRW
ncbi:outer membrane autotransporter barrel domain protein [compost metagenome]